MEESLLIFVFIIIFFKSDGVTRRSGLLPEFVDCVLKEEVTTSIQSLTTSDFRRDGFEYEEIYYETLENQAKDLKSENPRCFCSEDFSEVRCEALTDREGNSLFLPGGSYGGLANLRSDVTRKEKPKSQNKTEDSLVLTSFHLEKSSIKSILPRNILQNMKFQRIVFSFNELGKFLGHNLFSKETLESVEVLEMGKCDLGAIPPRRLLRGSKKLRRLYLWGNRIKSFPSNFFSDSRSLLELVLCGNNIASIDEMTFGGTDQLVNLKLLDLDKNGITSLQGIKLRDRFKQSSEFSGHSFSMSYDGKDHSSLSRIIGNRLEVLKLGGNNIHTLPSGFLSDFEHLKFLKLDNNGLSYVYPGAFDGLQSLVRLCLARNMIGYLPDDIFAQMSRLLILELQGNRLEHLWFRTFRGLASLQTLDISRNKLSVLAEGLFQNSPSLYRIDLSHNQLQILDECSFHRPFHRLQSVSLVENPIVCSCGISWLWRYMKSLDYKDANDSLEAITINNQLRPMFQRSLHDLDSGPRHHHRHHNLHHHHPRSPLPIYIFSSTPSTHRRRHLPQQRHQKKRHGDYFYQSNYSESFEIYDQLLTEEDDDVIDDLPELPEHMKPLRNLVTWGSCTLVAMETQQQQQQQQQHQHQQQQQHRGTKSTMSSRKDSKRIQISSFQVRIMFNCSMERCEL